MPDLFSSVTVSLEVAVYNTTFKYHLNAELLDPQTVHWLSGFPSSLFEFRSCKKFGWISLTEKPRTQPAC